MPFSEPLLNDPRPNRPTHPDFQRLLDHFALFDADAEHGGSRQDQIARADVDTYSLIYAIENRSASACAELGLSQRYVPILNAMLIDGFLLGVDFNRTRD
jgi:hypothetical protein